MKLLDRYIIKQFVLATLVSLAAFMILFVAIDLMEKLDKFLDRKMPFALILDYYVNFTPQMISLVLPIALLLGSLFTTGKMSQQTEIVATRSAGMSLYRFMLPFVVIGILVSFFMVYFDGWMLPRANARVDALQRQYDLPGTTSIGPQSNLHLQEGIGEIVVIQNFTFEAARADRVGIYFFNPNDMTKLYRRIDAKQMLWDSTKHAWRLVDAVERIFTSDSSKETFRRVSDSASMMRFSFTPKQLRERQLKYEELTNAQFHQRIDVAKQAGQDTARDEVDYYSKYAMSFTSLIVILFGVPFASQKKCGGLAIQFAIAIGIAFFFLAFIKVSQTFGYTGAIDPILTAWLANILFILIAIGVIARVQK
ncbi:MAG: LptF/LptG family permease [Bacteroidota bacterium]|nr:LptF/LptG family permease [Bacteroidota bacterium]